MENRCLYCYKNLEDPGDFHVSCSNKFFGKKITTAVPYYLEQMPELARNLVDHNTSVSGVQPKLFLTLANGITKDEDGLLLAGTTEGNYLFKPPTENYSEMPQNEHLTMRIAEAFGIPTVPSSLIRLQSGELGYITKRVDRTRKGKKIHMLDMFQILEAFDKYKSSMEKIGKAIHNYSANTLLDKITYFELTLFSFITGNNDMHLKNFSLINTEAGWTLAPAYDLLNVAIANPDDDEELALPIEGKKKKLQKLHFMRFGEGLGLTSKQINRAFGRLIDHKPVAENWISNSFLSDEMKENYFAVLEERYLRL